MGWSTQGSQVQGEEASTPHQGVREDARSTRGESEVRRHGLNRDHCFDLRSRLVCSLPLHELLYIVSKPLLPAPGSPVSTTPHPASTTPRNLGFSHSFVASCDGRPSLTHLSSWRSLSSRLDHPPPVSWPDHPPVGRPRSRELLLRPYHFAVFASPCRLSSLLEAVKSSPPPLFSLSM